MNIVSSVITALWVSFLTRDTNFFIKFNQYVTPVISIAEKLIVDAKADYSIARCRVDIIAACSR